MVSKSISLKNRFNRNKIGLRKEILEKIVQELSVKSLRWKYLFDLAALDGIEGWVVVKMIYQHKTGKHISQPEFVYARLAKLLATTEEWRVNERLVTKKDVVSWNRQAILAMIEAEKQGKFDLDSIERGYKTVGIINILYPEFLLK